MLRITENFDNGNTVRLRLDGTLSPESLNDLARMFSLHRGSCGRTIILDMTGVEFMNDQAGRSLALMRGDQLRIINCSPFIATLLATNIAGFTSR